MGPRTERSAGQRTFCLLMLIAVVIIDLRIFLFSLYFIYLYIFHSFQYILDYCNLACSRLNESCTHPCNVDK